MAHIRLKAVLQTSAKWEITDTSLLRWRRKLKSAAQECYDTLYRYRLPDHFSLEDEQIKGELSESTDLDGISNQCLQLFAPLFMTTVENIRKSFIQLHTQDFSWVPCVDSRLKNIGTMFTDFGSQCFCPNQLCCKLDKSSGLPYVSLDPIIYVDLCCQVSLSELDKQRDLLPKSRGSLRDHPYQRAGVLFAPHGSSEDMLLADKFPAIAATSCEEQQCLSTTVFTLGQLEQIILPKAKDFFFQNEEATMYEILWRSKHGTTYILVERACIFVPSTHRTLHGPKRRKLCARSGRGVPVILGPSFP